MKRLLPKYAVLLLVLCMAGAALFRTSQGVQRAENELAQLERAMVAEKERLRVLNAEWALLNSPYRLESLAHDYLDMDTLEAKSLVSYQDVGGYAPHDNDVEGVGFPLQSAQDGVKKSIVMAPRPASKPIYHKAVMRHKTDAPDIAPNTLKNVLERVQSKEGER